MKNTRIISSRNAIALAVLTAGLVTNVQAEGLEEVLVTAQKRSESLQDVPLAVTAFSGETMRDFGINNTQALQATT